MMDSETLISLPKSSASASASAHNQSKLPYSVSPTQSPSSPPPHSDHRNRLQSMCSSEPTTAKSSTWLQRLRASRGFPDADDIDLEHFLSTSLEKIDLQPSTDAALTDKRSQHDDNFAADKRDDGGALEGRDLINNVLSELFCMGEYQDKLRISSKKSCRKQPCPRIFVSKNLDDQNVSVQNDRVSSPSPLPLSFNSRRKAKEVNKELQVMEERVDEEEEKDDWDFSAYSQTEVTVIDSSVPSWKFEKTLYRRKNVWKAVDKKGKGLISGDRKKRTETVNDTGDVQKEKLKLSSLSSKSQESEEGSEKKRKMKKKKKKLLLCSSSNYVNKEEAMVQSKSTQGHDQGKMMVAAGAKIQDDCSQVQEKSFFKKHIDGGSSVIFIKSIPATNRKDVSGTSKGCEKSMQK